MQIDQESSLLMLRRRSTDTLIEDITSGRSQPGHGATFACLPLCESEAEDLYTNNGDETVFGDLCELSELSDSDCDNWSFGTWSLVLSDDDDESD